MDKEKRKEFNRALYQLRKQFGLCVHCGKYDAWAGRVLCAKCTERKSYSENTEVARARRLAWREKCRLEGLCYVCGKPAENFSVRCPTCAEKNARACRSYRVRKAYANWDRGA